MEENLERYKEAHQEFYEQALSEVKAGKKESHWMWFIFPQITGLGASEISKYFEIKSLEEATKYLQDELLGSHIREISKELLSLDYTDATLIFGYVDSLKLKSSMTLFSYISNEPIFSEVLDKYFEGEKDEVTIAICDGLKRVVLSKN